MTTTDNNDRLLAECAKYLDETARMGGVWTAESAARAVLAIARPAIERAASERSRKEALEEAAKVCEEAIASDQRSLETCKSTYEDEVRYGIATGEHIRLLIRALIPTDTPAG